MAFYSGQERLRNVISMFPLIGFKGLGRLGKCSGNIKSECFFMEGFPFFMYFVLGIRPRKYLVEIRWFLLSLQKDRIDFPAKEIVFYLSVRVVRNQDARMVILVYSFQAGCGIHAVSDNRVIGEMLVPDIPNGSFSGIYPDSGPDLRQTFAHHFRR